MTISEAIARVAALDLPAQRRAYLARQLTASNPDRMWLIVARAKAEAVVAAEAKTRAVQAEYANRAQLAQDRAQRGVEAPQRPSERVWKLPATDGDLPAIRPVTIRWVAPTKPADIERQRPERVSNYTPPPKPVSVAKGDPVELPAGESHGVVRAYNLHGCRCPACRLAKRESRKPAGKRVPNGTPPRHGTTTCYQRGCRCALCRTAVVTYAREKRHKLAELEQQEPTDV